MLFVCSESNDLYSLLIRSGKKYPRLNTLAEAVEQASPKSAVLLLADGYPQKRTVVEEADIEAARAKSLKLYVEYPEKVPGFQFGEPQQALWERGVIATDLFGFLLPRHRILALHGCHFLPTQAQESWLSLARVAGYDRAVYGIPDNAHPLLFSADKGALLIATTKLSHFVTGRYAPSKDWDLFWLRLLMMLSPGSAPESLQHEPLVTARWGKNETLPEDYQKQTFNSSVNWVYDSHLLLSEETKAINDPMIKNNVEWTPAPKPDEPVGDGRFGMLEGYASAIEPDGSQQRRTPIRADCHAESAMVLSLGWKLNQKQRDRDTAQNLLNYIYFDSGMHDGVRGDPQNPNFGHIAWGAISEVWEKANYGDDNARVLLGTMVASACLDTDAWDESMMSALLANLRTTGPLGFRGGRIDVVPLETDGWKLYHDTERVHYSPHYESFMWACYLWAYRATGHQEFLDKTKTAIRMTMQAYPDGWLWQDSLERARMLLCLSWLVRLEDTTEHREWLHRIADDLIVYQMPCGAIQERIVLSGAGHYVAPECNEAYGTREIPLIQENGNPCSDQLYTTGFGLLGLHEAATATRDEKLRVAAERLAEYLSRIQIRSEAFPYLNGSWFRAFDFERWEHWASSGDLGWGAWSIEAGWGQSWTPAILALREMNTSVWDLTAKTKIGKHLDAVQALMAVNDGSPFRK